MDQLVCGCQMFLIVRRGFPVHFYSVVVDPINRVISYRIRPVVRYATDAPAGGRRVRLGCVSPQGVRGSRRDEQ